MKYFVGVFILTLVLVMVFPFNESLAAKSPHHTTITLFDGEFFSHKREITFYNLKAASLKAVDLGTDGVKEFILGAQPGYAPTVWLARQDGGTINSFEAYTSDMLGGVHIEVADLNNNGRPEIITVPASDGPALVKVFDSYGELLHEFYAFNQQQIAEYTTVAIDVTGDGVLEIMVATGRGVNPAISVWSMEGKAIDWEIDLTEFNSSGLIITPIDLGGDGTSELVITNRFNPEGTSLLLRGNKEIINTFFVGGSKDKSILSLGAADVVEDGREEIIVFENSRMNQEVRVVNGFGELVQSYPLEGLDPGETIYDFKFQSLKGVVFPELILIHSFIPQRDLTREENAIEVSVAHQRLQYYDDGFQMASVMVSTGKPSTPTPIGEFKIDNKFKRPYSRRASLYMPYWMAYKAPAYGFHELPEWSNGAKEGADHLGKRVSGGCIRLPVGAAQAMWEWADVGVPVSITNN